MLQLLTTASMLATLLVAKPTIEIGCSLNRRIGGSLSDCGSYYMPDEELNWGCDAEITVCLIKYAGFRIRPFGIRVFDRGGYGFIFFHNTQFDVTISPFGNRRFDPYVYIGYSYYAEYFKPPEDIGSSIPAYHIQVGPGFQYKIKNNMRAYLECTFFDQYQTPFFYSDGMGYSSGAVMLGVDRVFLGIKFKLQGE